MSLTSELATTLDRLREEADLDSQALDTLDRIADALAGPEVSEAIAAAQVRLPERGVHLSLHYLLARLEFRSGDHQVAAAVLDRLLERLNQDGRYSLLIDVARRNTDWLSDERLIPLVVRAARADPQALSAEILAELLDRFPDDPRLHWIAGLRARAASSGQSGATPEAIEHLVRALAYLAREADDAILEEAALPVIEGLDHARAVELVSMLAVLIERRRIDEAVTYLELAGPGLLALGQAPAIWNLLMNALTRDPESTSPLRMAALDALRALPDMPASHARIISDSGLADSAVPFPAALARYRRLMEFPPGEFVEHGSWGVGEIVAHDGETLTVRFPHRPDHLLKRSLADRALERRKRDDLRVLRAFFPERLAELRDQDPAALVAVALRELGGEGKSRDVKRLLSPAVIPAESWTDWWRKARSALKNDERIDLSQIFRDTLRLGGEGEGAGGAPTEVQLPGLADGEDLTRQIKLLRRFLEQHPVGGERAARAYRRRLERWLDTRANTDDEKLLVLIVIASWDPAARPRLRDALVDACRRGFSISAFPDAEDQRMLLELGLEAEDWQPVAMAALDSREPTIRRQVQTTIEERLGPGAVDFYRAVLDDSPGRGDAVLEVARLVLAGQSNAARVPAVELFIALLKQVSDPSRETLQKQALALLTPGGPVFSRLASEPSGGPAAEQVALALLGFHASDSFLFPILAALETIWGPKVVEAFQRRRERETRRITARMDEEGGKQPVGLMTRASFRALSAEIDRVDLELRTTIPRAIQKARELGDLRESGEYESAKLKQRQASDRLLFLQRRLSEAQIIEDIPIDDSVVTTGTEVTLIPIEGGDSVRYWVLGDGDTRHGPDVVSYAAELGRALWRRRVGDEIELPLAAEPRRFRIAEIRRRLPIQAD